MTDFAKELRALMERKGITAADLAKKIIEQAETDPGAARLLERATSDLPPELQLERRPDGTYNLGYASMDYTHPVWWVR